MLLTNGLTLRPLLQDGETGGTPEALVIMLFMAGDTSEPALQLARHWHPLVPRAAFLGVELDDLIWRVDLGALQRVITQAAEIRDLSPDQILLVGLGQAGALAVEMVLHGLLPALGVIARDLPLPLGRMSFPPGPAAFRLVQHCSDRDPENVHFHTLLDDLRREDVDVRAVLLPEEPMSRPDMALRAGTGFLVELVARAGARMIRAM